MANDKHIIGIFHTESEAISAINRLKTAGYQDDEISVLSKNKDSIEHIEDATNTDVISEDGKAKVAGGAAVGGIIGGAGALLAELGLLAIPGVGPFLAAGPIVATLTGAIAGGAVGGIVGALVELGVDKSEAEEYEKYLNRGDILVLVNNMYNTNDEVYNNFYDNNSVIRDRYNRNI